MKTRTAAQARLPRTFAKLNQLHPLRPIRGRDDFEHAQHVADRLAGRDDLTPDQRDYLESLAMLMEKYEDRHEPFVTDELDPIDTLKYLMEGRGMSESDLGRLLGERSLGNALLNGRRDLSKAHIQRLCAYFSVGPALFLPIPSPQRGSK
jgi:HTH-type transcriptional regulator/antitoxin HigA